MALVDRRMRSTLRRKFTYIEVKMTKLIASFALVVIVALGLNAQIKSKFSATAHDFLEQSCAVDTVGESQVPQFQWLPIGAAIDIQLERLTPRPELPHSGR
jgi:hypothetical protein